MERVRSKKAKEKEGRKRVKRKEEGEEGVG
jgi:hypothetical protein